MNIDKKIIEIRKNNNLTQEELAERLNVSRQTVSNWENRKCYPDIETLIIISNKFNISLDHLLKDNYLMVKEFDRKIKRSRKLLYTVSILFCFLLISAGIIYYKNSKVVEITNTNKELEESIKTLIEIPTDDSLLAMHRNIDFREISIDKKKIDLYIADQNLNLLYEKPLVTNIKVIAFQDHENHLASEMEIEDIDTILVYVPNKIFVSLVKAQTTKKVYIVIKDSKNEDIIINQEALDILNSKL